jgi:hypothetical protein
MTTPTTKERNVNTKCREILKDNKLKLSCALVDKTNLVCLPEDAKMEDAPFSCLDCKQKLKLKAINSKHMRVHFSHYPIIINSSDESLVTEQVRCHGESTAHKGAKLYLAKHLYEFQFRSIFQCYHRTLYILPQIPQNCRVACEIPYVSNNNNYIFDIGITDIETNELIGGIEIYHKHKVEQTKFLDYQNHSTLQFVYEVKAADVLKDAQEVQNILNNHDTKILECITVWRRSRIHCSNCIQEEQARVKYQEEQEKLREKQEQEKIKYQEEQTKLQEILEQERRKKEERRKIILSCADQLGYYSLIEEEWNLKPNKALPFNMNNWNIIISGRECIRCSKETSVSVNKPYCLNCFQNLSNPFRNDTNLELALSLGYANEYSSWNLRNKLFAMTQDKPSYKASVEWYTSVDTSHLDYKKLNNLWNEIENRSQCLYCDEYDINIGRGRTFCKSCYKTILKGEDECTHLKIISDQTRGEFMQKYKWLFKIKRIHRDSNKFVCTECGFNGDTKRHAVWFKSALSLCLDCFHTKEAILEEKYTVRTNPLICTKEEEENLEIPELETHNLPMFGAPRPLKKMKTHK